MVNFLLDIYEIMIMHMNTYQVLRRILKIHFRLKIKMMKKTQQKKEGK